MWVWSCSHIILLLLANAFYTASCQEKSSLTFVIDNTGSMYNDIRQVRESANGISEIVFEEKSSQIRNMLLVTFNDPAVQLQIATENRSIFKRKIDGVGVYGGGDCPEVSMKGILLALESSLPGSFIYVFTDASAKDYYLSDDVKNMCQKKQSQIVFVLTGFCNSRYEEQYQVYYDIATACSGLAFDVDKREVHQILSTIKETIKGNKTVLTSTKVPPRTTKNIPFTIDDQTEYAIVTVSGIQVSLSVSGPSATQEQLTNLENAKSIKLSGLTPGTYTAKVRGNSETSLYIVGRTDFIFHHGFSNLQPKSLKDTTPQPIADSTTVLSIAVTDPKHTVDILLAQILDMNDRIIDSLLLTPISNDFYSTQPFRAPSRRFKIAVIGRVVSTGQNIRRVAKLSVTPQEPPKLEPTAKVPVVRIPEGKTIEVTYAQTMKLTCKVTAYPPPTIEWINERGVVMYSQTSVVEPPYEFISYLSMPDVSNNGRYTCRAVNRAGTGTEAIDVVVRDPFVVRSIPKGITEIEYNTKGTLRCDITSPVAMHIKWYRILESVGARQELVPSDKFSISADGTALTINRMDLDMVNTYRCIAILDKDENKRSIHETKVKITGLKAPKVTGQYSQNVLKGSTAAIKCDVTGTPRPKITWLFKAKDGSKFESIKESKNVLHISYVDLHNAGAYKCIAHNVLGDSEHITTLNVLIPPKIDTSSSHVYNSIEGKDAVLKIPCTATGLPKPVITWTAYGATITQNAKYTIENGALVIREPNVSDSRLYTCVATNDAGSTTASFQANIFQMPKVSGEKSKTFKMGDYSSIRCNVVKGVPQPTMKWYFKGKDGSEVFLVTGISEIVIPKVDKSHAGTYKCVAQNEIGRDELLTTVTVQFAPVILSNDTVVLKGMEGDKALRIPCETEGEPKPSVSWKLNDDVITTNEKYRVTDGALIIKVPNTKDSNSYTCEAKNYLGLARATFKVNIESYLDELGPIEEVNVVRGSSIKLDCGSNDSSQSVRWFQEALETGITGNYFHLSNLEVSSDSNYTCRVSDVSGHTATKTYIVIVGYPPEFSYEQDSAKFDFDGSEYGVLDCHVEAKPIPDITWMYNGKVLEDQTSAELTLSDKWGQYTCNVSNIHGSVQRSFDVTSTDCLMNRQPENIKTMPLILNSTFSWPLLDTTTGYLKIKHGQTLMFSCPNAKDKTNALRNIPGLNEAKAICDKQDIFEIQDTPYKLSDLRCTEEVVPIVNESKVKCLSETSEAIRVGFDVHGFLETYEVCFDISNKIPLYTRAVMSRSYNGQGTNYNWSKYSGFVGNTDREKVYTCDDTLFRGCYSKIQLVNARDFSDGPAQRSTFIDPLNAVPYWNPEEMTESPWHSIEDMVRSSLSIYDQFVAWSGTHMVQEINGHVIPRYLWKVLRFSEVKSIAIVYVNSPSVSKADILCKNTCPENNIVSWITNVNKYMYCCKVDEFLQAFNLRGTTVGEPMKAALDKISSKIY